MESLMFSQRELIKIVFVFFIKKTIRWIGEPYFTDRSAGIQ